MNTKIFNPQSYSNENCILDVFNERNLYMLYLNGKLIFTSRYEKVALKHIDKLLKKYNLKKDEI